MCRWLHDGAMYEAGETLPNGDEPAALVNDWRAWIEECLVLMDGDGRLRHLPYPGSYRQQPDYDMGVLQVIRSEFNKIENERIEAMQNKARTARG
ncbi:MAG: hypothetical protein U9R15_09130 [Chloroflexota bacterium]|nr:hypothetical protein [Chloroflexota bacterium]